MDVRFWLMPFDFVIVIITQREIVYILLPNVFSGVTFDLKIFSKSLYFKFH